MSFWWTVLVVCVGIVVFGCGWLIGHAQGLNDAIRVLKAKDRIDAAKKERAEQIKL